MPSSYKTLDECLDLWHTAVEIEFSYTYHIVHFIGVAPKKKVVRWGLSPVFLLGIYTKINSCALLSHVSAETLTIGRMIPSGTNS
jgi:hypothetical protein